MAVNWHTTSGGKMQIEEKAKMKGRLGRSPDHGLHGRRYLRSCLVLLLFY